MSWSSPIPAITYAGMHGVDYDSPISTTTASTGESGSPLRIFLADLQGIPYAAVNSVDPSKVGDAGVEPASDVIRYVVFLDSEADGQFLRTDNKLSSTWIPNDRDPEDWRIDHYASITVGPGTGSFLLAPDRITVGTCAYTEPCVVVVPEELGGGWLMLLRRARWVKTLEFGKAAHPTAYENEPASEGTISDIVCYWSASPDFTDPGASGGRSDVLKGPVLLVDSIDALPEFSGRVFCGVPSAVFVENNLGPFGQDNLQRVGGTGRPGPYSLDAEDSWLFVYYAVDLPGTAHLACEEDFYQSAVKVSDYVNFFEDRRGFIAVKRIHWAALAIALGLETGGAGLRPPESTNEAEWTPRSAVPGELLGRVRLWVPRPFIGTSARRAIEFLSRKSMGTFTIQRATDPEAEPCGDGYALFFTGYPAPPTGGASTTDLSWRFGHGVWRASAIPGGEVLWGDDDEEPTLVRTTIFGVDFAIAFAEFLQPGPDLVLGAAEEEIIALPESSREARLTPADADAVRWLPKGLEPARWNVSMGGLAFLRAVSGLPAFLGLVTGDDDDGCRSWQDAWTFPDPMIP